MERILVAVMTSAPLVSVLKPEFNSFLFASIGEDRNGMQVSVLSGLAQSDLDPWQEAAKLAELPGNIATERLASLFETLPGRAWTHPEAQAVATRLIGLLPHSITENSRASQTPHTLGAMMNSRLGGFTSCLCPLCWVRSLSSQAINWRRRRIKRM
jgi:hypothetical protein